MATEFTLQDLGASLQDLIGKVNNIDNKVNNLDNKVNNLDNKVNNLDCDVKKLTLENERSNDKLTNYQQASQSLVNLAFSLIASATLITVVSAVFKR
jgi:outer membrane murein-binding lipoprotein Lpp